MTGTQHRWVRWPDGGAPRIGFGADYNPEQWPREVWDDDARLMRAAGVNIVSLAIFSWARLQPSPTTWNFGWLDDVMDLLHENGIAVDLATATASPPPWLTALHPEILPLTRTGETVWPGARQHWRPTSKIFAEHSLALVEKMAQRYAQHPALAAWHISNELGCHNVYDYSDDAAHAFRGWLSQRYKTIDRLNDAWGTAFWSQTYSELVQVLPPRLAASYPNPTQQLDFKRFSSDALKAYLIAERDVLRRHTPDVPVTTNFMVMGNTSAMNYADWADEVDFVANDHYVHPGPQGYDELAFSANLTGHLAGRRPWFLMEHSTSAVNWQHVNTPKRPGELARDSLAHVAHGADAVCFFQWRQSAAGAEKYHSAMVPHAGEDSTVFRDVVSLGQTMHDLAGVAGTECRPARAALLFDWDSWWVSELDSHPSQLLRYRAEALDWYSAFLACGVPVDVVPAGRALDGYQLVVAPILHVVPESLARELTEYVSGGGHLITTYFSGIVDENDHVWPGGYPGALRELLGTRIEEFGPLAEDVTLDLDTGGTGSLWGDRVDVVDPATEVLARYAGGDLDGAAAITRRPVGSGTASYVATRLDPGARLRLLTDLLRHAGVSSELPYDARGRVELVVRGDETSDWLFCINRTRDVVDLSTLDGEVVITTHPTSPAGHLGAAGVLVLRRTHV